MTISVAEHQEAKIAPSPRFPLIIPGIFGRNAAGSDPLLSFGCTKEGAEMTVVVTGPLPFHATFSQMIVSLQLNSVFWTRFCSGALGSRQRSSGYFGSSKL